MTDEGRARELALSFGKLAPPPAWVIEKIANAFRQVRADEQEACARIADMGCLVPPDGGSPTEGERLVSESIAAAIRARTP